MSEDGSLIAYQANGDLEDRNKSDNPVMRDRKEAESNLRKRRNVSAQFGFVRSDFVYGVAKTEDIGKYRIRRGNRSNVQTGDPESKGKVIKKYQTDGIYILSASFDEDMITLERASKDGDTYTATAPDYITNNEQKTKSNIALETYATDLKQTQVRLTYNDGIADKEPKVLKPKQILFERPQTITFSDKDAPEKYYVYGHGGYTGRIYKGRRRGSKKANDYNGVVVDSSQNYVWERGNRNLRIRSPIKMMLNTIKDRLKNQENRLIS